MLPDCFLRPFAHRGLHTVAAGRIENSAPAFEAAIYRDFGIECDVRAAADGLPVVFHDPDCRRVLGRDDEIADMSPERLASISYRDGSRLLTYEDFLAQIGGRVPILVELKGDWKTPRPGFIDEVARLSQSYRGPMALMSLEPDLVEAVGRLTPSIPRGLVAARFDLYAPALERLGKARAKSLARLESFEVVGASLVAYEVCALPTQHTERLRRKGIPVFAWTVRSGEDLAKARAWAEAPIFEGVIADRLIGAGS
jgi:glycerophosphoryl diester phosphodiesterase